MHVAIQITANCNTQYHGLEVVAMLLRGLIKKGVEFGARDINDLTMIEFAEKCREDAVGTDAKGRVGAIVEFLNKSSSWGYSGLDEHEIREFHKRSIAEPERVDSLPLEQWFWDDDNQLVMESDENSRPEYDTETE